jgi:Uma2 family endonuclease
VVSCDSAMQGSDAPNDSGVFVQYAVHGFSEDWVFEEGPVPESVWHDQAVELLKALLVHFVARTGRDAAVFRNLAIRVREDRPRVGFDPDVMLVEPRPRDAFELSSLRIWEPGQTVPALVIEVVSPGHPYKDYRNTPDQCAALGVTELVVFDPLRVGPKAHGGPALIQIWRKEAGVFTRIASGDGPFRSPFLDAYLVAPDDGRLLRITDDHAGTRLWPTPEEAERAARRSERARAEAERAQTKAERERADAERAEKERALARVAELEAELARLRTTPR